MWGTRDFETYGILEMLRRARGHWKTGEADEAERCCRDVLAVWPGQADALYLLGIMASASGNLELAIDRLRQASSPARAPAVYSADLADLYRRTGQLTLAEASARRAVGMDPNLARSWHGLGMVLKEVGKIDESRACLERAVALKPQWAEARCDLINVCRQLESQHPSA